MLAQYQKSNLEKLRDAAKDSNELVVVGSANSGRKYVIEQWGNNLPKTIVIKLKETNIDSQYFSLVSELKNVECIRKKTLKFSPSISISGILGSISTSLETDSLLKKEDELVKRLLGLTRRYSLIFIIDKSLNISDGSIELIEKIKKEFKKESKVYIIYVSNNMKNNAKNIYFDDISSYGSSM